MFNPYAQEEEETPKKAPKIQSEVQHLDKRSIPVRRNVSARM